VAVERIAIVATLKADGYERAQELVKEGPPFDLGSAIFERHAVYLSPHEIVFVFEGPEVEWKLDDLMSDFRQPKLSETFDEWRDLIDGDPRMAGEAFYWEERH
jgi:hypothetical protein